MEKTKQTPAGARLESLLGSRWGGSLVDFLRAVGEKDNLTQKATHWKNRGAPTKWAAKAAELLACEPHEISAVKPAAAKPIAQGRQVSLAESMLLDAVEGLDRKKIMRLVQVAGWLSEGRTVSASDPPSKAVEKAKDGR